MTDEEVELVAAELARVSGISWSNGQEKGPLKVVCNRYRDRARVAIAALERYRAGKQSTQSCNGIQGQNATDRNSPGEDPVLPQKPV